MGSNNCTQRLRTRLFSDRGGLPRLAAWLGVPLSIAGVASERRRSLRSQRGGEAILRITLSVLVASFALAGPRPAFSEDAATPKAESQAIEALIASVAQLSDATFLRNGKSYPASTAARFLREKWQSRQSEVRSAEEFIDRIASFSSTTSKPYLIRFADGRQVSSAEYLRAELVRLRARAP
jgi:hypothetical protein